MPCLRALVPSGTKMSAVPPRSRALQATPWPWLPLDDATMPSATPRARARTRSQSAPRSLKEAIGEAVSFLSQTSASKARLRISERTSGVSAV